MSKQQPAIGIPVNQPNASLYAYQNQSYDFSSGLCDCTSDVSLCCLTLWCPCITFGRIAEIVDKGSSSCGLTGTIYSLLLLFTGCHSIYSFTYRQKMKAQFGMQTDCCGDCCTHFWCEGCALCQEYRELQHRGYDVALGWHANLERQNQGTIVPPVVQGTMNRRELVELET